MLGSAPPHVNAASNSGRNLAGEMKERQLRRDLARREAGALKALDGEGDGVAAAEAECSDAALEVAAL